MNNPNPISILAIDSGIRFGPSYDLCCFANKWGGEFTIVDNDINRLKEREKYLSLYSDKIKISFVLADGWEYLKKHGSDFTFVYLDAPDKPEWFTFECFKQINPYKAYISCNGTTNLLERVKSYYPDYRLYSSEGRESLFYRPPEGNKEYFEIGNLKLDYYRGWKGNREASNNRACEIALLDWFAKKFDNNILEIGDVGAGYEIFKNWPTLDPYGPYKDSIRKDVLDFDYSGLNVVSVSTFEHFSESAYNNTDKEKPIKALEKIAREAKNWLIVFDIGADRYFEDWLRVQDDYNITFLVRENKRGLVNNWKESKDLNNFYLNYGDVNYKLNLYGNALALCLIWSDSLKLFLNHNHEI